MLGVPTDGSAAHVRALLDELDANGSRVAAFGMHRATLDDVFLSLTGRDTGRNRAMSTHGARPVALTARCLRLVRRNTDALIMALVLPVMLMLLFVYVFGGAINTGDGRTSTTWRPA